MDKAVVKQVIMKYRELLPKSVLHRGVEVFKTPFDKAHVIVGPRRAGKTFLLYQIVKKKKGKEIVFVNFEDNLLDKIRSESLNEILECSKELFGEELVFFFDEIQEVERWESFVVSLLNQHYEVYITGSNSRLLSKDIATSLRGKSLSYLLLPFSFSEYLQSQDIILKKNFEYTSVASQVKKKFKEFFTFGGFPEVVLTPDNSLKNKLINNYFDSVLYKDLVDRLQLKNIKLVEITMKYLLNLYAQTFSISGFEHYLKSKKVPYSLEDLYVILKSLQDVFMVMYVKQYSKSFKKSEFSKSKVYLLDVGYASFLSTAPSDYGRLLENIVFIELFRREGNTENKNIFYDQSGTHECDFVITKRDVPTEAIQVTYELNDKNREREINGLLNALGSLNIKKGLLLTYDQEEEIRVGNKKIIVTPVWKWLLEKDS